MQKMLKTAWKILFLMIFWKLGFMGNFYRCPILNAWFLIEYKSEIHLNTIHARILKIGMFLPSVYFHNSGRKIFEILLFGRKTAKNGGQRVGFLPVFCTWNGQKIEFSKSVNQIYGTTHKEGTCSKFQVPSMYECTFYTLWEIAHLVNTQKSQFSKNHNSG